MPTKKFYFFGIERNRNTFSIKDPIFIRDDRIEKLAPYYFSDIEMEEFKECIDFIFQRDILFGAAKNSQDIRKFLNNGVLLEPAIRREDAIIYFLKEEKGGFV